MAVRSELENVGLTPLNIQLGEIDIKESQIDDHIQLLEQRLIALGFELLQDQKIRLVEQIKSALRHFVRQEKTDTPPNISSYLAAYLKKDYASLSHLFSQSEHTTIESYFIKQKIERVKELLAYGELNLNEIAYKLHYSSVAHLSNQFKKITGLSPTAYKKSASYERTELDKV
ncbi:hypothetical protein GCM10017764_27510 [Sphingobacterium griseoflavum]|uniref:HTH araC/xylS-type domain-containing protein n=2 Tax=Sphingobacterium griseoflavum TaxID=1474952 RepID=A0ABQ3I2B7_9SPHI|nr:hypothetical protein GCM10017764_27510 [Sphingobacterium griseoflavum]